MHQHVDSRLHHAFLILQVGGVSVNDEAMLVGLLDERDVHFGRHLLQASSGIVPVVHPKFDLADFASSDFPDDGDRLVRGGDLVDGVQRSGSLDQEHVGTASRRRHACRKEEPGGGWKLTRELVLLESDGKAGGLVAHGHSRADPEESLPFEVVEHVFRRVVGDAPTHISFVSDMDMHIVHRGHDRLAGEIDMGRSQRHPDRAFPADRHDVSILDEEGALLQRRAGVTDDYARAFIKNRIRLSLSSNRSDRCDHERTRKHLP